MKRIAKLKIFSKSHQTKQPANVPVAPNTNRYDQNVLKTEASQKYNENPNYLKKSVPPTQPIESESEDTYDEEESDSRCEDEEYYEDDEPDDYDDDEDDDDYSYDARSSTTSGSYQDDEHDDDDDDDDDEEEDMDEVAVEKALTAFRKCDEFLQRHKIKPELFCRYKERLELQAWLFRRIAAKASKCVSGFVSCTLTNPIWFIKTRLQLNHHKNQTSAFECMQRIYQQSGFLGFYKGISASYVGISETVVHFVIYEAIKTWLIEHRERMPSPDDHSKTSRDFVEFMAAGALSKTVASCVAYPHEVIRTRLREEGTKYQRFWQTTNTIFIEEGFRGLYRGLATQLVRQIPNTAIMMATYEAVVYILTEQFQPPPAVSHDNSDLGTEFYTESKSKRDRDLS